MSIEKQILEELKRFNQINSYILNEQPEEVPVDDVPPPADPAAPTDLAAAPADPAAAPADPAAPAPDAAAT